ISGNELVSWAFTAATYLSSSADPTACAAVSCAQSSAAKAREPGSKAVPARRPKPSMRRLWVIAVYLALRGVIPHVTRYCGAVSTPAMLAPTRRRASMKRLLLAVLLGLALPAAAQYPNRTVTMLTGYPAGGLVDIVARMVAENMKPRFPAGLVVVNRPGAAGAVAVGELTRAAPDGYTIILTPPSRLTLAPQINAPPYQ